MKKYALIALVFAFASCGQEAAMQYESSADFADDANTEVSSSRMIKDADEGQVVEQDNLDADFQRKLIKTGNVEFETLDLFGTDARIRELASKYKAYISNENEYKSDFRLNRSISLRIPADDFDKLLAELSDGVDHFDSRNIEVSDVTEEYLDIKARLKTKKELEARYLELLKKANKVSEILEIEREIGNLRSQIESIEGRLKYINDQVSLSTLHIRYYMNVSGQSNFWLKVNQGFGNGWDYLKMFVIGLVNLWPFILILAGLVWYLRKRMRRKS